MTPGPPAPLLADWRGAGGAHRTGGGWVRYKPDAGPVCGMITRRGAGRGRPSLTPLAAMSNLRLGMWRLNAGGSISAADGRGLLRLDGGGAGSAEAADRSFLAPRLDEYRRGAAAAARLSVESGARRHATGGRAMTGPVGGFAAIAGTDGGGATTMRGSCRGCGTILRGAGGDGGVYLCRALRRRLSRLQVVAASCRTRRSRRCAGVVAGEESQPRQQPPLLCAVAARAHVAGLGHLRPVDLWLLPIAAGALLHSALPGFPLQVSAHTLGLIALERTGMGLLFGYADRRQSVQDFPALDFQFARQIVDSNFTHPPLFAPPHCGLDIHGNPRQWV